MKKLLLLLATIFISLLIANIGAWLIYPKYAASPLLVIAVWEKYFPNIPKAILTSSAIAVFFFSFATRKILFEDDITTKSRKNKYGYAKYIKSLSALKKHLKNKFEMNFDKGIVLGKMNGKFIRSDKPYSCLVLAPPGTGKTAGIVVPNLLLCENSMITHDPKGELWDLTSESREKHLGHKSFLFDPASKDSAKFNIFAKDILPKEKDDYKAYITNVANIIFSSKKGDVSASSDYFLSAARSAFSFFAQWLIEVEEETSLPKIREKLLEDSDIVSTVESMISDPNVSKEVKEDGRGVLIAAESENQWAGVMGQLKEGLDLYGDARIRENINDVCDFTGDLLRQKKISVYLKVRDKDKKRLAPLITMMLEAITNQLISQMPRKEDNQVTLILDEFVRLGRLESIAELPAISRGYNVNTLFIAQDYEQISTTYGKEYLSIFDSNCAYKIVFRQNNHSTAERISKTIGNRTDKRKSSSSSKKSTIQIANNESKSTSISEEGLALVTPQDILNLDQGKILILAQGNFSTPILADAPLWFKENQLRKIIKQTS